MNRPGGDEKEDGKGDMLEIKGLEKAYGDRQVLRGVDLQAEPGEIVGLLGPNGAGKTTLVSIVAGLRTADAGSVKVGGVDALAHSDKARQILGLAPQDLGIYPTLSARKNLEFFAELAGLHGAELRRRVGALAEALDLAKLLNQKAGELSGGQKRRLHTAMALVNEPKVLFMDEPTVGADVRTRSQILEVVRQKAEAGCAIVYTSHYLNEIEDLGATVAVLENARIIARSPLPDMIARYGSPAVRLTFEGPAPELEGFTVDGSIATLRTPNPAHSAAGILGRLNGSTDRLRGVEIVQPSLEAAYLALTGRRSNEDVAGAATTDNNEEISGELVA
jgi:ABC-2 type transport system ATP-binding protein